MLKQALTLWRTEKNRKGTTLHRRLLFFFMLLTISLILVCALLLSLFGITGRESEAIEKHIDTELAVITDKINHDFGKMALGGISIAEELNDYSEDFFNEHNISASQLSDHPDLIEPLLSEYMQTLLSTIKNRYCGGVFVLLDASLSDNQMQKSGIFIKKTQPTATDAVGVQLHFLRGPAALARQHDVMLLGQWMMEYDITGEEFFTDVMNTARDNPDLPLSRLYYWSGRTMLEKNSEAGFLLCVPLRSDDGEVFGICGAEVSDRMFKSLYTTQGGGYESIFTVMAPNCEQGICASKGLIAGNSYLSSTNWSYNLINEEMHEDFHHYSGGDMMYGGKTASVHLYPGDSPFEDETWSVSVLLPKDILHTAIKGKTQYFYYVMFGLLLVSLAASFLFSRQYLRPVNTALDKIKSNSYHGEREDGGYYEIEDLFAFLSQKDRDHDAAIREKDQQMNDLQGEHEKAQTEIDRLSYSRKKEIDPDRYQLFVESLDTLTKTERIIFGHYLDGKSAKDIMEIMVIKESTLKYHNKNIYNKLGVTSRNELLRYATIMNREIK